MTVAAGLSRKWCIVAVLLALVPLLYPAVPPLTDLPAHMARFMIQLDAGRSPELARWYSFDWNLIPNLGTDLLAEVLVPAFGLEPAMKVIALLIVGLQASGYLALAKSAHGRVPVTALFALPLAYAAPFQYGFLNFTFAIALSTLALALWLNPRMAAKPILRWAVFVPIACVIWVSHLAAWAVLCLTVGACEWMRRIDKGQVWPLALGAGFLSSTCLLVPQVLRVAFPQGEPAPLATEGLFHLSEKLFLLLNVLADRWSMLDLGFAYVLIAVILIGWVSPRYRLSRGLALASLVMLAAFLILPRRVYGSYYADMRMVPTVLALAVLAIGPKLEGVKRGFAIPAALAVAFLTARLAVNTVSMAIWANDMREDLGVVQLVPRNSMLVSFTAMPCRTFVLQGRERRTHYASYALVRRHAFANDQWAMSGGQLLTVHNPAARPFETDPSSVEIGEECYGEVPVLKSVAKVPRAFRRMWIVWDVPELPVPGWKVVARSGESVLYQR